MFYRLNVISLIIPPLRDRKDDIPSLIKYFIEKYNQRFYKSIYGLSDEVYQILLNYSWPGNVRELENCIEYMVSFETNEYVQINNLPNKLRHFYLRENNPNMECDDKQVSEFSGSLKELLAQREQEIIKSVVSKYEQPLSLKNIKKIRKILDISVASFYRKWK